MVEGSENSVESYPDASFPLYESDTSVSEISLPSVDGCKTETQEEKAKSAETSSFQPDWLPSFLSWRKRNERPLRDTFRFGLEDFVSTFRACSPYISAHQNSVFVIHIPGQLLEEALFETTIQDIALLNILGVKVVLVAGSRPQIDSRLAKEGIKPRYSHGFRVTDSVALKAVKDAAGFVRYEIESKLSRGVFNTPTLNKFHVVSGNFFTAIPKGVIDGVDFAYTGQVRKVEANKIRTHLDRGDIVILTNVGFSPSGELFNCSAEEVASTCAVQLNAEKLIFFTDGEVLVDSRSGSIVHNLPLKYAQNFFDSSLNSFPEMLRIEFENGLKACKGGVRRIHLLNRFVDGVLLMELYTRDGAGMMISRDIYEGIRKAALQDIGGILQIIEPLENAGILVRRRREQIEKEIDHFVVVERDGMVIACAALHVIPSDSSTAELACLAVHPEYRRSGKGDALLGYLEREAYSKGVRKLFILSTRTFQWFLERGFKAGTVEELPEERRKSYNRERNSKIFIKFLEGNRAVDEEELLKRL
ncbi:amino-acid N-acetyltransferase [Galdieria sulphuraria]|uniref:amino-acid N-acetyltransferase n=1 Tax=Galdieria sulphuraria TaxID=130081 RepID=M2Y7V5_GALSU|nr:amino-acid N-acetyltransferase [Galdieria sulphuraria]EME32163.1 amino-acid N-acetyltransferase [Galdieria sulphuraria]|eukprot:XP_005708683.1 amino-acid N-acetyltransferase [Galdieria sulphuraria]